MSCLKNLQRVTYTNDMIMNLIKLYKFHGKEFYYSNILKSDLEYFKKNVIEKDSFYLIKFLKLNISEARIKLILTKDSEPKNNDEKIAANIKQIITIACNSVSNFELSANQIDQLVTLLFRGCKKVGFDTYKETTEYSYLLDRDSKSKKEDLDILFDELRTFVTEENHEITNLICNFYIDFINIKPFKEYNDFIGILILYNLLFKYGFTQFKYISFFETLYLNKKDFDQFTIEANYNWENGFSKVEPLNNFIVNLLLKNYFSLEQKSLDYDFDSKLNKTDNIENTISKAPEIFDKLFIRAKHPTVSDSTIDRTLKRLRDEGKIKPLGTGRSAKWHKVNMDNDQFSLNDKDTLFDIINENM